MYSMLQSRQQYYQISSISAQLKPYLRRSEEELPEVALTGSDVSHVTGINLTGRCPDWNRKSHKWSRAHSSSTKCSTVVQIPWLLEVTKGHVIPKGVPLGVRMRNRKLRHICPSGAFHRKWRHQASPIGLPMVLEVTWSEVGVLSRTIASY